MDILTIFLFMVYMALKTLNSNGFSVFLFAYLRFVCVYTIYMLTKEEKQKQIEAGRMHDKDTGSSAVQVSILSRRIQQMNNHLKDNHKDKHSRRGLVGLVEQRRKHLSYLKRKNSEVYESVVEQLGLRK